MDALTIEPCEAELLRLGNSYAIRAYPLVDTGVSTEGMFVGITFEIVNGKYSPIATDEWNRRVGTREPESILRSATTLIQTPVNTADHHCDSSHESIHGV